MSQKKIQFFTIADVERYIEDHFDTCPNEDPTSLDLLVMLSQAHPQPFSEALFHMGIKDEDAFNDFLEKVQNTVLDTYEESNIEPDVGQMEYTQDLRDCLDAIENFMANNPMENVLGETEHGFTISDLMSFILKDSSTFASMVLEYGQHSSVKDLEMAHFMQDENMTGMGLVARPQVGPAAQPQAQPEAEEDAHAAENFLKNLTAQAKESSFEPVIGRDDEIQQAVRTLLRKEKRNPIFVGEAGVGKTSLAYGIVQNIIDGNVPEELKGREVVSLDIASLVAGTKYRGDFEKRMKNVLEYVKANNAILFIDEIHMICGAGAVGKDKMDASNILKTYLSDQKNPISVMGATTFNEFKLLEKDGALERRVSKLVVKEPSKELAITMIEGKRAAYEAHHSGVRMSNEAIQAAVDYSARHIHDRCLPDKALDILDLALAAQRDGFVPENGTKGVIGEADVVAEMSRKLGREIGLINDPNLKAKLMTMTERFNANVINQEGPINKVVRRVRNAESGLFADERTNKTLGAFMFTGSTGVGKTELTQQLAKELGVPMIRYDMSEYQESTSFKRLVGSDPGYVGYEEGGKLINDIRENPSCVLLLDEIEKAHPSVYKILLQIMDNAKLTDGQGRVADFQNVYVVMTSNIGATLKQVNGIGFNAVDTTVGQQREEMIKQVFSSEFVGRLDDVVEFNNLDKVEDFVKVLDIHLAPQIKGLADKGIKVEFEQSAKEFIAQVSLKENLGARPAKKAIRDYFQSALVDAFCEGTLAAGDTVVVKAPENDNDTALDIKIKQPGRKALPAPKALV